MKTKDFWTTFAINPDVIEPTYDAALKYLWNEGGYGSSQVVLTQEHLDALNDGKAIAWGDGEYSSFLILEKTRDEM